MQFQKRRQYVVNKTMQYASVIYVCMIVLAILAFHTWLTHARLSSAVKVDPDAVPLATLLLQDVLITLVVTGVCVAFMMIYGSHRVAGPLFRCEKAIKRVQEGDLTDVIRLRKGDLLVPFSEELNLALANLREFAHEDRRQTQEATRLIALARGAIDVPEIQKNLDRAVQALNRVGARLQVERDVERATLADLARPDYRPATPIYMAAKTLMLEPPSRAQLERLATPDPDRAAAPPAGPPAPRPRLAAPEAPGPGPITIPPSPAV